MKIEIYSFVDYIAHYHCANFRGDRVIHSRDLKGGGGPSVWPASKIAQSF